MLELQVPLLAAKALILLLLFAFIYAVMSRGIGDLRKIPDDEPYVPGQSRSRNGRGAYSPAPNGVPEFVVEDSDILAPETRFEIGDGETSVGRSSAQQHRPQERRLRLGTPRAAHQARRPALRRGPRLDQRDLRQRAQDRGRHALEERGHRPGRLDHLQVRGVAACPSWSSSRSASPTPGKVRQNNEDALLVGDGEDETLFVVADGIGGFEAGEVASSIAVEVLRGLAPGQVLRGRHSGGEPQHPGRRPRRREALGDGHHGGRHKVRRHAAGARWPRSRTSATRGPTSCAAAR